jgi:hypothetical protein
VPKIRTFGLSYVALRRHERTELRQIVRVGRKRVMTKPLLESNVLEKIFGGRVHVGKCTVSRMVRLTGK